MFDFFDADASGALDPDEFLSLLNQVFPEHCDENERRALEAFPEADTDGSGGISFPEFIAYFDVLRALYDDGEAPVAPTPTAMELAVDDAKMRAELEAELVLCPCGHSFLPSVLPQHQRTCPAVRSRKREVHFIEEQEQDPLSSDAPPPPLERSRSSVEFANNGANTFVSCDYCGRTFFPDRLQIHLRVCKARSDMEQQVSGIRPTIDQSGSRITVGLYTSLKSGKYTKSGIALTEQPGGAVLGYSPQVQELFEAQIAAEREAARIAAEKEAARLAAEAAAEAKRKADAEFAERQKMMTKGWVV